MTRRFIFMLLFFPFRSSYSQQVPLTKKFLRLYADNDALILSNKATDWGYTSGNRIDLFYTPVKRRSNLFNWFNRSAGTDRVNTSGWGFMQMIITPKKTRLTVPDKNDYPYSGALFAIHTIHSSNTGQKINFQSEWIVGVMGPPSFAKETHIFFHRLIKDHAPMGWDHQLPSDLLLNYNPGAEKQVAGYKNFSFIGGGKLFCGSMTDGLSVHLLLRIGNNKDYFSGLSNQYFAANKPRLSISLKTSTDLVLYNALLDGGLFNKESPLRNSHSESGTDLHRQKMIGSLELFMLFSIKKIAVSFSQKLFSPEFRGYGSHAIGNISTLFSW